MVLSNIFTPVLKIFFFFTVFRIFQTLLREETHKKRVFLVVGPLRFYPIPAESLAGDGSPLFYTQKTMFMYCVIRGGSGGAGPS